MKIENPFFFFLPSHCHFVVSVSVGAVHGFSSSSSFSCFSVVRFHHKESGLCAGTTRQDAISFIIAIIIRTKRISTPEVSVQSGENEKQVKSRTKREGKRRGLLLVAVGPGLEKKKKKKSLLSCQCLCSCLLSSSHPQLQGRERWYSRLKAERGERRG